MEKSLRQLDTHLTAVGVVAHTARQQQAEHLAATINANYISIDDGTLGPTQNHLKVWATLATRYPNSEWLTVIEDDAIPCNNFRTQLDMALAVAPRDIIGLYLGTGYPIKQQPAIAAAIREAEQHDAHWTISSRLHHAVGTAIRTHHVPDMITALHDTRHPIDDAITRWMNQRLQVAYTLPSLLDHHDQPTVIKGHHRGKPRKAWRHGTRERWYAASA